MWIKLRLSKIIYSVKRILIKDILITKTVLYLIKEKRQPSEVIPLEKVFNYIEQMMWEIKHRPVFASDLSSHGTKISHFQFRFSTKRSFDTTWRSLGKLSTKKVIDYSGQLTHYPFFYDYQFFFNEHHHHFFLWREKFRKEKQAKKARKKNFSCENGKKLIFEESNA